MLFHEVIYRETKEQRVITKTDMTQCMNAIDTQPSQDADVPGQACVRVFVMDRNNDPLMPCTPRRARLLLKSKRADVYKMHPFTIRLLDREGGEMQPVEMKVDPGSKTTGLALMVKGEHRGWFCIQASELSHRGQAIVSSLLARAQLRRGRRGRNTRYRKPRFSNRIRKAGWLLPSLRSRVDNVVHRVQKVAAVCPLSNLAVEQVRFDMQLMDNPEISGVSYQQGTLAGYEVREYLLLKWDHKCSYCEIRDVPLQVEHIHPRSLGGSNRVSNLCLACQSCNQKKGNRPVEDFLRGKPEVLARILRQAKGSLKDAAAVNATRKHLVAALRALDISVSTGSGGQTKFNRSRQGLAKAHWIDAACVGDTGNRVDLSEITHVTLIQAKGRGSRQMCKPDRYGFPRTSAKSVKRLHGFQTGDGVRLTQPSGKYQGTHEGVVSIRATGLFDIKTQGKLKITAPYTRFTLVSRFDGYAYSKRAV